MAYRAIIGSINGNQVQITFTNDVDDKYSRIYTGNSGADIVAQAQAELSSKNVTIDFKGLGLNTGSEITLPAPVVPDPNVVAFLTAKATYQHYLNTITLGVHLPGDKVVTDAKTAVATAYNVVPNEGLIDFA